MQSSSLTISVCLSTQSASLELVLAWVVLTLCVCWRHQEGAAASRRGDVLALVGAQPHQGIS